MSEKFDITCLIVTWNNAHTIESCLTTLEIGGISRNRLQIIVIDNASSDNTVLQVQRSFPGATVIRNQANRGFARAVNQGIKQAVAPLVLLLNPDARLTAGALKMMQNCLLRQPGIVAVGPRLESAGGIVDAHSIRCFPTLWDNLAEEARLTTLFPRNLFFDRVNQGWRQPGMSREVACLSGAAMLIRRSALEMIGLLDEGYFLFGEDLDLCWRLAQVGKLYYCAEALVWHQGKVSTGQQPPGWVAVQAARGMERFYRQTRGPLYATLYRGLIAVSSLVRIGLYTLAGVVSDCLARTMSSHTEQKWLARVRQHGQRLQWVMATARTTDER